MNCPNCGLSNPDSARFCANCGTPLPEPSHQAQQPYTPTVLPPTPAPPRNSITKNIGLGCLVVIVIFFFLGLSCTRACFRHRRYYRRYSSIIRVVPAPVSPTTGTEPRPPGSGPALVA